MSTVKLAAPVRAVAVTVNRQVSAVRATLSLVASIPVASPQEIV